MIDIQNLEIGYKIKRKTNSVFTGLNAKFEAGALIGLIGDNGIGKSTALRILSGNMKPNLGNFEKPPEWKEILKFFRGSEL